ncbi:hypothetical protein HK104_002332 [Borealophlyctis nickersoniae]|nr:hypothetical protein HK104_002332 [Borealophlyctis nickersoniae]
MFASVYDADLGIEDFGTASLTQPTTPLGQFQSPNPQSFIFDPIPQQSSVIKTKTLPLTCLHAQLQLYEGGEHHVSAPKVTKPRHSALRLRRRIRRSPTPVLDIIGYTKTVTNTHVRLRHSSRGGGGSKDRAKTPILVSTCDDEESENHLPVSAHERGGVMSHLSDTKVVEVAEDNVEKKDVDGANDDYKECENQDDGLTGVISKSSQVSEDAVLSPKDYVSSVDAKQIKQAELREYIKKYMGLAGDKNVSELRESIAYGNVKTIAMWYLNQRKRGNIKALELSEDEALAAKRACERGERFEDAQTEGNTGDIPARKVRKKFLKVSPEETCYWDVKRKTKTGQAAGLVLSSVAISEDAMAEQPLETVSATGTANDSCIRTILFQLFPSRELATVLLNWMAIADEMDAHVKAVMEDFMEKGETVRFPYLRDQCITLSQNKYDSLRAEGRFHEIPDLEQRKQIYGFAG